MTTFERFRTTATNVLHANENAKKVEEYQKKARRNAIAGGGGVIVTLITSVMLHRRWSKNFQQIYDERTKKLNEQISDLEYRIDTECGGMN